VLKQLGEEVGGAEDLEVGAEIGVVLMLTLYLLCRSGVKKMDLSVQHLDA
jgi:hypothetical protein